jgi:hypothetical protein
VQTVLETSKATELEELAEADLPKDEDNPTTVAVGPKNGDRTVVYAGVNSKDQAAGRNQHFRAFDVHIPERSDGAEKIVRGDIVEVGRSSLFTNKEKDTYQRVLRLSRPYGGTQLGAVTTGLAKESEIVVFDTSKPPSSAPNIRGRVKPGKEAADVDILQTGEDEFLFAYCTDKEVFVKTISSKTDTSDPKCIYVHPGGNPHEKPTIPSFRSLKFISSHFLLMLTNIHSRGGVVLQILRIPGEGEKRQARLALSERLSNNLKNATGLAVSNLTPPVTASEKQKTSQYVIAVAGQDISISLFTLEFTVSEGIALPIVSKLKAYRTFKDVHPLQMTSLTLSTFTPPKHPVTSATPPQYLKLASVSVGNTVIVHTLPLSPIPLSLDQGQSKTPRYVLRLPSDGGKVAQGIIITLFLTLVSAVVMQIGMEVRGYAPPRFGAAELMPRSIMEVIGKPYLDLHPAPNHVGPADPLPEGTIDNIIVGETPVYGAMPNPPDPAPIPEPQDGSPDSQRLAELLRAIRSNTAQGVIYVSDTTPHETSGDIEASIKANLHDEAKHGPHGGKTWEELTEGQRKSWEKKLKSAGEWVEGEIASVLKGVVFGELGGVVRAVVE